MQLEMFFHLALDCCVIFTELKHSSASLQMELHLTYLKKLAYAFTGKFVNCVF